MSMFFSASTSFFYSEAIHGNNFPVDAVEITSEHHAALLSGQSDGKRIDADASGTPVLIAPLALTLGDLKDAKNANINTARLTSNRASFFHAGKSFACDELSRSDIDGTNGYVALYGALPPGWVGGWKTIANDYHPIADVAEWKAFYTSMFAAGAANFAKAQDLKTALADATTAEQVAAIVW